MSARLPHRPLLAAALLVLGAASTAAAGPAVTLVETAPVETSLDHPGVPEAYRVWPEMMGGATERLDVASFYVSNEPESRLEPVLQAMIDAAGRGVRVRVLSDAGFYKTYPKSLDRLDAVDGIEVRLIDYRKLTGGVMHAKYFVVDGREAYFGSQNFDWRALTHIHEIGLRVEIPAYARTLEGVFGWDWDRADPLSGASAPAPAASGAPPVPPAPWPWTEASGDTAWMWPALSPRGQLPDSTTWDLPQILRLLAGSRDSVHVTVLTYSPATREKTYWPELDDALRAAAVRGVAVKLMVADWSKRKPTIDFLKSLAVVPGIEVRLVTIPPASAGFIPYARVTHAKYLTVDAGRAWVGTGNWERSYFYTTRNVGVVVESRELTGALDRDFNTLWFSGYAEPVRPEVEYTVPRIGD